MYFFLLLSIVIVLWIDELGPTRRNYDPDYGGDSLAVYLCVAAGTVFAAAWQWWMLSYLKLPPPLYGLWLYPFLGVIPFLPIHDVRVADNSKRNGALCLLAMALLKEATCRERVLACGMVVALTFEYVSSLAVWFVFFGTQFVLGPTLSAAFRSVTCPPSYLISTLGFVIQTKSVNVLVWLVTRRAGNVLGDALGFAHTFVLLVVTFENANPSPENESRGTSCHLLHG